MACNKRGPIVWLVGRRQPQFKTSKLPTKKEVLAVFFHRHLTLKQTVRSSATTVAEDLLNIWQNYLIRTRLKKHVINKIEQLFRTWCLLQKNQNNTAKRSNSLKAKEAQFQENLKGLFDIAHAEVRKSLRINGESDLLQAIMAKGQEEKRTLVANQLAKADRKRKRLEEQKNRDDKEKKRRLAESVEVTFLSSQETVLSGNSHRSDAEFVVEASTSRKMPASGIITPLISSTLDRTNISDRKATVVLQAVAHALGHEGSSLNLSRSTVRRTRQDTRLESAKRIKERFAPPSFLTVHWDGKLLPELSSRKLVDRLPVLVAAGKFEQLLAVPKLDKGTGVNTATAVYQTLTEWSTENNVVAMSFDTTASNTGRKNGACICLEGLLDRNLLYLSCRHHIHELLLEAAFSTCMSTVSSGPNIPLFQRFRDNWPTLDPSKYETALDDSSIKTIMLDKRDEILDFVESTLENFQPREDYKELLELVRLFVGDKSRPNFRTPGAVHRARWMAKAIYALKIYMFRGQFSLTKKETTGLRRISLFIVIMYVRAWYQAPCAVAAPKNDLSLLQALQIHKDQDEQVSIAVSNKLLNHLWYLSPELIAFAFFDETVSCDTKRQMVESLKLPGSDNRQLKATIGVKDILTVKLSDFVSTDSKRFFEILRIEPSFLSRDPDLWRTDENYLACSAVCKGLRVVNDTAERGVALIHEFNRSITNNEAQKQDLLLVVSENRRKIPNVNKSTIDRALKDV